jgi:uncharacterized protein YutE (UPF0331/DUF86 family)
LDRIRELAAEIRRVIRELRALGGVSQAEFLGDAKAVNSAKYLLLVACEASIDICNHVAARRGARAPEDYSDCFEVLRELKVLDDDLAKRLARMARFRNLLVHLYWKVDDARIYQAIRDDLGDYEAYLAAIGRYLVSEI